MDKIRFSVIVPVFNVEKYLEECVDSILNQKYQSFEVILVDDGSKDNSGFICDNYAEKYPELISVIHKKNEGLISARRAGLKQVQGEYVCFVDSDDYVSEELLQIVDTVIKKYKPDIITFQARRVNVRGDQQEIANHWFSEGMVEKKHYFKEIITSSAFNSLCLKICRFDLFDVNQDYTPFYGIQRGEDLLQSLPLIRSAKKIYYLKKQLYYYRQNPESISHKCQKNQYRYVLNVILPLLYQYMFEMEYDSEENIRLYYKNYLLNLWEQLKVYSRSDAKPKEFKIVFKDMSHLEHVKNAERYVEKSELPAYGRIVFIGIRLFYTQNWSLLIFYLKLLRAAAGLRYRWKRR